MNLHARQLALAAGAPPERVDEIAGALVASSDIRLGRAQDLVAGLQG